MTLSKGIHRLVYILYKEACTALNSLSRSNLYLVVNYPKKVNYTVIMVAIKSVLLSSAVLLAATAVTAEPIAAPTPAPTPIGHAVEKRADIGEGIDSVISVVTSGAGGVISTITVSFAWHSHC